MTDKVSLLPAVQIESPNEALQAQFIEIRAQNGDQAPAKDGHKPGDTGTAKPSDKPKIDVGDKLFNSALNVNPADIGQGFKDAQAAAKAFMAKPDKHAALEQGAPAFEAAIKTSDSEYISAIAKYSPDYNVKRHAVEQAQMAALISVEQFKGVFQAVPEDKQEKVEQLANLALSDDISPQLRASIRKELEQFPGINKALDGVNAAVKAEETAADGMTKAAEPLLKAAYEQAATRYIYSHAMELGGQLGPAALMKEEGRDKVNDAYFEFLDKPKPPKQILRA